MFFLDMFLSATRFPSLALTAQAFQCLPLHSLLLSPGQAGGSGVTIRKGRSHQLHARKAFPHRISLGLSSPHLQVPKSVFLSNFSPCSGDSGPARECFLRGCEQRQSFLLLSTSCSRRKGWACCRTVRKPWLGVGAPSLHRGQILLADSLANVVRL